MAGHLPADRSANQRVTSAGDSFLCIRMCGTQHTYIQSKKQAKIAPVENSKRAGSTGLSWDLRQKLARDAYTALIWAILAALAAERSGDPREVGYIKQRDDLLARLRVETAEKLNRVANSWAATQW